MSTNHTPNYNLNQWVKSDQVLMEDFNADNAKLDAALKEAADARSALSSQLGSKADASALAAEIGARASAVSTLNSALARRGNCEIGTLTYTGNGEKTRTVAFPSKPALIIVIGTQLAAFFAGNSNVLLGLDASKGTIPYTIITSWSGSELTFSINNTVALMNSSGHLYTVVAFYDKA